MSVPGSRGRQEPASTALDVGVLLVTCNSYMRYDSRLSGVLHVLLHMAEMDGPVTSETLAKAMGTNPVVVRRIMAGLREQGYVRSEKGMAAGGCSPAICRR